MLSKKSELKLLKIISPKILDGMESLMPLVQMLTSWKLNINIKNQNKWAKMG